MIEKTAIITGASRGVGRGISKHLAKLGYRLGIMSRNVEQLNGLRQELISDINLPMKMMPIVLEADVSNMQSVQTAVEKFVDATGTISVLVNNAGIMEQGTTELDNTVFQRMINTNLLGVFHCIKSVSLFMKKQRSGYIFNIASAAGKNGFAELGGYSATKFGMIGLGESVMKELTKFGIKLTNVCPNLISTDMTKNVTVMPHDKMIPIVDIAHTIEYLLKLSPETAITEININCSVLLEFDV